MAYNYYPYLQTAQPVMQAQSASQTQAGSSGGFVSVRNELEARNYPVAFGNSVTFRDENAPYIYTKTMGFSQLDRPIFDKYRLVKEEPTDLVQNGTTDTEEDKINKSTIEKLRSEIEAIWSEIEALKKAGVDGV